MNRTNLTSDQAEALVSGTARIEGLEHLSTIIDSLRIDQAAQLDEVLVDRVVKAATLRARESSVNLPLGAADRTRPVTTSVRSLRRRIATIAATAAVLLGSGGAVAYAADRASPGDFLYGIDRALETLGIGNGGTQERLTEVEQLIANGDVARGLEHAAVTITEVDNNTGASDGNQAASAALARAAQRARETGSNQADATKEEVAALLDYLAGNIGHVDGQKVAELARLIGNHPSTQPLDQGQRPAEPPGQSKTDGVPPGQSKTDGVPPGQSKTDPNVDAPGQSKTDPNVDAPGQSKTDGAPPGQSKTDGVPPGQSKTDGAPPGQSKADGVPPGQSKAGSNNNQNRSSASQAPNGSKRPSNSEQSK
ncbi:MAG: hypothetical protein M5U23_07805 [Acidimicrobiia bacterium]|nr:hypothetical protein [Acidimicrobiia bacterium]